MVLDLLNCLCALALDVSLLLLGIGPLRRNLRLYGCQPFICSQSAAMFNAGYHKGQSKERGQNPAGHQVEELEDGGHAGS